MRAVGLVFTAVGAEGLAAFNARSADPACFPMVGGMPFAASLGALTAGLVVLLLGSVQLVIGIRDLGSASA